MYISYDSETYPFFGTFYRSKISTDGGLLDQKETREDVLLTPCDITERGINSDPYLISSTFSVYFPIGEDEKVNVRRGDMFEGNMYGMEVNGKVKGVFPSTLGGCVAYLEDLDIEHEN